MSCAASGHTSPYLIKRVFLIMSPSFPTQADHIVTGGEFFTEAKRASIEPPSISPAPKLKEFTNAVPYQFVPGKVTLQWKNLTDEEKVLFTAVKGAYDVNADLDIIRVLGTPPRSAGGQRVHKVKVITDEEIRSVVDSYRKDPKLALAMMRSNLITIVREPKKSDVDLQERLTRYYDASVMLEMRLDAAAFPPMRPDAQAIAGIPKFLPDGYSDMGWDKEIAQADRLGREKIRVDKGTDLAEIRQVMCSILWSVGKMQDATGAYIPIESDPAKTFMVASVANFVHSEMKYSEEIPPLINPGRISVNLNSIRKAGGGVCRHQAMMGQEMMQHLGITSRFYKNYLYIFAFNIGNHASNLVRINSKWYLLDITNPDQANGKICFHPLPEPDRSSEEPSGGPYSITKGRRYLPYNDAFHRILQRGVYSV